MNKRVHKASAGNRPAAGRDQKMLHALEQFRIIFRSVKRHYQSVERRAGITGAQLWALSQVSHRPRIRVGDFARALSIHLSTASNLLRGLEELALVSRQRESKDHRTVQLVLTRKGEAVLRKAPQPLIGVLQQSLSQLSVQDLDALNKQLGILIACMERSGAAAPPLPISELHRRKNHRRL